jgi:hypothetical protein
MTPYWILGIVAVFTPMVYSIMPVHGADICLCAFFYDKFASSWRSYPTLTVQSYNTYQIVQNLSCYALNYGITIAFVYMIWKIRHIRDDTQITEETAAVGIWLLVLAPPFFVILSLLFMARCEDYSDFSIN